MLNEVAVVTTASDVSAECQAAPRCQAVLRALPGSPSLTITPALVHAWVISFAGGGDQDLTCTESLRPQTTRKGAWLAHGPTARELMCNRNSSPYPAKVHWTCYSSPVISVVGFRVGL